MSATAVAVRVHLRYPGQSKSQYVTVGLPNRVVAAGSNVQDLLEFLAARLRIPSDMVILHKGSVLHSGDDLSFIRAWQGQRQLKQAEEAKSGAAERTKKLTKANLIHLTIVSSSPPWMNVGGFTAGHLPQLQQRHDDLYDALRRWHAGLMKVRRDGEFATGLTLRGLRMQAIAMQKKIGGGTWESPHFAKVLPRVVRLITPKWCVDMLHEMGFTSRMTNIALLLSTGNCMGAAQYAIQFNGRVPSYRVWATRIAGELLYMIDGMVKAEVVNQLLKREKLRQPIAESWDFRWTATHAHTTREVTRPMQLEAGELDEPLFRSEEQWLAHAEKADKSSHWAVNPMLHPYLENSLCTRESPFDGQLFFKQENHVYCISCANHCVSKEDRGNLEGPLRLPTTKCSCPNCNLPTTLPSHLMERLHSEGKSSTAQSSKSSAKDGANIAMDAVSERKGEAESHSAGSADELLTLPPDALGESEVASLSQIITEHAHLLSAFPGLHALCRGQSSTLHKHSQDHNGGVDHDLLQQWSCVPWALRGLVYPVLSGIPLTQSVGRSGSLTTRQLSVYAKRFRESIYGWVPGGVGNSVALPADDVLPWTVTVERCNHAESGEPAVKAEVAPHVGRLVKPGRRPQLSFAQLQPMNCVPCTASGPAPVAGWLQAVVSVCLKHMPKQLPQAVSGLIESLSLLPSDSTDTPAQIDVEAVAALAGGFQQWLAADKPSAEWVVWLCGWLSLLRALCNAKQLPKVAAMRAMLVTSEAVLGQLPTLSAIPWLLRFFYTLHIRHAAVALVGNHARQLARSLCDLRQSAGQDDTVDVWGVVRDVRGFWAPEVQRFMQTEPSWHGMLRVMCGFAPGSEQWACKLSGGMAGVWVHLAAVLGSVLPSIQTQHLTVVTLAACRNMVQLFRETVQLHITLRHTPHATLLEKAVVRACRGLVQTVSGGLARYGAGLRGQGGALGEMERVVGRVGSRFRTAAAEFERRQVARQLARLLARAEGREPDHVPRLHCAVRADPRLATILRCTDYFRRVVTEQKALVAMLTASTGSAPDSESKSSPSVTPAPSESKQPADVGGVEGSEGHSPMTDESSTQQNDTIPATNSSDSKDAQTQGDAPSDPSAGTDGTVSEKTLFAQFMRRLSRRPHVVHNAVNGASHTVGLISGLEEYGDLCAWLSPVCHRADPQVGLALPRLPAPSGRMVYHLVSPGRLPGKIDKRGLLYTPDDLKNCGFVHCSPFHLVCRVANDYFKGPVWVMELDSGALVAETKWEAPAPIAGGGTEHLKDGDLFPHIYGPVNLDALRRVAVLEHDGDTGYSWPAGFAAPTSSQPQHDPLSAAPLEKKRKVGQQVNPNLLVDPEDPRYPFLLGKWKVVELGSGLKKLVDAVWTLRALGGQWFHGLSGPAGGKNVHWSADHLAGLQMFGRAPMSDLTKDPNPLWEVYCRSFKITARSNSTALVPPVGGDGDPVHDRTLYLQSLQGMARGMQLVEWRMWAQFTWLRVCADLVKVVADSGIPARTVRGWRVEAWPGLLETLSYFTPFACEGYPYEVSVMDASVFPKPSKVNGTVLNIYTHTAEQARQAVWWFRRSGKPAGPVSYDKLFLVYRRVMLEGGLLVVCSAGFPRWVPVEECKGLVAALKKDRFSQTPPSDDGTTPPSNGVSMVPPLPQTLTYSATESERRTLTECDDAGNQGHHFFVGHVEGKFKSERTLLQHRIRAVGTLASATANALRDLMYAR